MARADVAPYPWQLKALATAQYVWHPTCGQLALRFADPAAAGITVVNDAPGHEGQLVPDAAGFTAYGSCQIGINSSITWREQGYPVFCTIVLHEGGRSANMRGTNGRGIMGIDKWPIHGISRVWRPKHRHGRVVIRGHWQHFVVWEGVDKRCLRPIDLKP